MSPSETLDTELSRLERDAKQGDIAAVERLVAIARRTAELPPAAGIVLNPRETGVNARSVRNWFISLDVDGRTGVETGPKRADGGFRMRLLQRKDGGAVEVMEMRGYATGSGVLGLEINGERVYTSER